MINRCPGQDNRKAQAENIACLHCGYLAEIFSDEVKIICPGCRHPIYRKRLPSCLNWCKAACECVGEAKYKQFKYPDPGD